MSGWQAVVFDLDDTLYPERDFVLSGFRAVAGWTETHLGIPAHDGFAELRNLFEQGVRGDTFNRWLAAHGLADEGLVTQLVQAYRGHTPRIAPFPEVPGLLQRLHHRYHLGLVSDGYLAVQQRKLAALGLSGYFDAVVFSDEWGAGTWKPSPYPFQVMLECLGVEASWTAYIADNPAKDFLGAHQAGLRTVWVRRPGGMYSHLNPPSPQHAPDVEIASLTELESVLKKLEELVRCKSQCPLPT
jgi:putative hydrolase of the HAD superfamily